MNLRELYVKSASGISIDVMKSNIIIIFKKLSGQEDSIKDNWFKEKSFFRFCYHYALENAPNHNPKMQNYVALFGFTRTLTLIFVLFFWLFVLHAIRGRMCMELATYLILSSGFIGYIFFIAFNKFYRRFCLEAMMAASVAVHKNVNEVNKSQQTLH